MTTEHKADSQIQVNASPSPEMLLAHIWSLLNDPRPPTLPPEWRENGDLPQIRAIHEYISELRLVLDNHAKGDFSRDIRLRGVMAGKLKAVQANFLHLVWQMQMVADGDFTQRVDFMGAFSDAFNRMVGQLDQAVNALKHKEKELERLASELEREIKNRDAALAALQVSERNYRYLAEHDTLTGILNRRSFFKQAEVELATSFLFNRPACVAILDVDHFKKFNDTHGHPAGDEALRHVVKVCLANLRHGDMIARFGGEEFVLYFASASMAEGKLAAERVRSSIESMPVVVNDKKVRLTVSIGVAEISPESRSKSPNLLLDRAVRMADTALYRAKQDGRNLVEVSDNTRSIRKVTRIKPEPPPQPSEGDA
ncbi:MAG: diguanylate cyclase [Planctomycetes bacterium]|nr:diguanylate cyclase [Planctomycetota bacterium]